MYLTLLVTKLYILIFPLVPDILPLCEIDNFSKVSLEGFLPLYIDPFCHPSLRYLDNSSGNINLFISWLFTTILPFELVLLWESVWFLLLFLSNFWLSEYVNHVLPPSPPADMLYPIFKSGRWYKAIHFCSFLFKSSNVSAHSNISLLKFCAPYFLKACLKSTPSIIDIKYWTFFFTNINLTIYQISCLINITIHKVNSPLYII